MIHDREPNMFPVFKGLTDYAIGKDILDFGGNRGNLIYVGQGEILEEDYTCLDVSQDALDAGKEEFPNSTWIHYNYFNCMYNPTGSNVLQFPTFNNDFDYIWSFSVVTHTDLSDMVKILRWMKTFRNAKVMVSFLDKANEKYLNYFYKKRIKKYGKCIDFRSFNDADYFYLIDSDQIIINAEQYSPVANDFLTFYDVDFLKAYLNDRCIPCDIVIDKVPFIVFENT